MKRTIQAFVRKIYPPDLTIRHARTSLVLAMKNTLTLIFLLALIQSVAQTPAYFENDQKWIGNELQSGILAPGCLLNNDYLYYIDGDTSITGYTYKKLMRKGWTNETGLCYTPPAYYEMFYCGFRQVGTKIYINIVGEDSLYVDYDLNVGDTLAPCYLMPDPGSIGDSNFIVQSIDSVLFSTGYHKRFHFNYYPSPNDTLPYYLLEGVGVYSSNGLSGIDWMDQIIPMPFEWEGTITCYLQNDILEYGSGGCNLNAFDFNVGIEEHAILPKVLIKTVDLMGREVENTPNTVLIQIFTDGTTERVFTPE